MATGKVLRARGRGQLVGCLVQIGALGWLAVVAVGMAVVFPYLSHTARAFVVPIALGIWMGTLLPSVLLGAVVVTVRRNRSLDRAFATWGPGRALAPVARAWATDVDGRQLNAWFSKGPQLELYLACSARTEGGIGADSGLSRLASGLTGRERIELGEGLVAGGRDADWMRALTADPGARAALCELLADDGRALRVVTVLPDAVKLTLRYFDLGALDPEHAEAWTRHLTTLARTIEALPPPAEPMEPGRIASRLRTNRGSFGGLLLFTAGVTFAIVACGGLLSAVIVFLDG